MRDRIAQLRLPSAWAVVTTAVLCGAHLLLRGGPVDLDHAVDEQTVAAMRHGTGFWAAMDHGLRYVYGPASTIRAYRMPTIFLLWRWLPPATLWPLFVAMAALCGWLAQQLSGRPWTMPAVAALVLAYGKGLGYTQYLLVEPWAVPCILGCFLAYRRQRWGLAVALALGAGLIREQAAVLLVLGLVIAIVRCQPWRLWLAAIVAWCAAFALHVVELSRFLVPHGRETHLMGTSHGLSSVLHMAGFGLPFAAAAGVLVYGLAWRSVRHLDMAPFVAPYLAMPIVGLLVDRPYWGILTVPVALALATAVPDPVMTDPAPEPPQLVSQTRP